MHSCANEVEPLDLIWPHLQFTPLTETRRKVVDPLKEQVRQKGLWATHLGPELGGQGYGQLKLALLNEILGRSSWAPIVFGCQAPDTGNAEIIAHYGTPEQKERYLRPLLDGELFSSYSMTEPQGGADPTQFTTSAVRDGDDWVINGWKYFSSNANTAAFLIVMVVTNPDVSPVSGHVDVPAAHRHSRRQHRPQRRPARRTRRPGQPRADPLRERARTGLGAARRRGPGVRHRADPARRRPDPPRDAHHRDGAEGDRHDVRTRAEPRDRGQPAGRQADRAGLHRRLLRPAQAVPAVRALHRMGDRQVQRLQEGAQGHRHGQGRDADGAARHRLARNASPRCARRHQRDALPRHGHRRGGDGTGRRPHRGAQDTVAKQVLRDYKASDDVWPSEWIPRKRDAARARFAEYLELEVGNQ